MKRPRVHELKQEYGSELDWVISFIGDWHLLSNYQSVLMKVYHDAGLELAESSGQRGNFSIHQEVFKLQENASVSGSSTGALYWQMFKAFECARDSDCDEVSISDVAAAKANMLECNEMKRRVKVSVVIP